MLAFAKETAVQDRSSALQLTGHCLGARLLLAEDNEINQQVSLLRDYDFDEALALAEKIDC